MKIAMNVLAILCVLPALPALAQTQPQYVALPPDRPPTVNVGASATATLANDRMHAWRPPTSTRGWRACWRN